MNKTLLIFGAAKLQRSLIENAKILGIFTVGIDPNPNAECNQLVDAFEVIDGDDYEGTLAVARRYNIDGVITASTDKPLLMMAVIAEKLGLPFYTVETAIISTDKFLMKEAFIKKNIPCAKGMLAADITGIKDFKLPVIVKPRDNSGSRGVVYCENEQQVKDAFLEAKQFSKKETLLVEEYIDGKEYSIESLHYDEKTVVVQFTEKITSPLPYNVELGHNQPAGLSDQDKFAIKIIIENIAKTLGFKNCASHTELKINSNGIFVIETSPRLGGDFITSHLVPLSTGINMEEKLIYIALGLTPHLTDHSEGAAIIRYLKLKAGVIDLFDLPDNPNEFWGSTHFNCDLYPGKTIPEIKNSLDRYGEIIFSGNSIPILLYHYDHFIKDLNNRIKITETN